MKIYVAGPYTKGDVALNVASAIYNGDEIMERNHTPFIPHLTHFWHMLSAHEWEQWMEYDLEWLETCDALLRIPGESIGADIEVKKAKGLGLKIYYDTSEIPWN